MSGAGTVPKRAEQYTELREGTKKGAITRGGDAKQRGGGQCWKRRLRSGELPAGMCGVRVQRRPPSAAAAEKEAVALSTV